MPENKTEAMLKNVKATAFNWVFTGLITVVIWLVTDMHEDLKAVMKVIPVMQLQIDYLQDGQLKTRFQAIPKVPAAKHEDIITLDSLTQQ
jgi:hypothetical protein